MERIQNQKHGKETFYYSFSRMLERTSFYGFRGLLVLYMVGDMLKMEETEALNVYGWFTLSILVSQIIGAFFGDLLIGNRKAILIGGIVQALGAFSLCIPSTVGLYLGLFFISIGGGLFTPNIIANFGKGYVNRTQLLDAGFTVFFLLVNMGAFFGSSVITYLGNELGYNLGFVFCGLLSLLSLLPILKTPRKWEIPKSVKTPIGKGVLRIIVVLVCVFIYWNVYDLLSVRLFILQHEIEGIAKFNLPNSFLQSLTSGASLPFFILAIIVWTFLYYSQVFKVLVGCLLGALAFGIVWFIPDFPADSQATWLFISIVILAISETHITPVVYSVITKYSNPKYLALLVSITYIPIKLFALLFDSTNESFQEQPAMGVRFGMIVMTVLSIVVILYVLLERSLFKDEHKTEQR